MAEKVDYFSTEPDDALKTLTENNWNNPLHWTQAGKHTQKTDDQEVKEFLGKDTGIKKVDDYFK